jgi:hypothetical protein
VRALTDEELRVNSCLAGRLRAAQFTWQRAAEQTLGVYRKFAASG